MAEWELDYNLTKLDNGLTIATRRTAIPDVVINIQINEGALNEPPDQKGILHFGEHMAYRSRIGEDIKLLYYKLTGRILQGDTTQEYVSYSSRASKEGLEYLVALWGRAFTDAGTTNEGFEAERGAIMAEAEDFSKGLTGYLLKIRRENWFPDSPFGEDMLETPEDFAAFTQDEVVGYKTKHMNASNTHLIIVGGFEESELLEYVQRHFGNLRPGETRSCKLPHIPALQPIEDVQRNFPISSTTFIMAYQAPTESDPDFLAHVALVDYLAGASSVLWNELREKRGLIYDLYPNSAVGNSVNRDVGTIFIEGFQLNNLARIKGIIFDEIGKIQSGKIDEERFELVKNGRFLTFYEDKLESPLKQAYIIQRIITGIRSFAVAQEMDFWRDITPDQIVAAAQKYLSCPFTTHLLIPK